jgi:hypothetical protein
MRAARELKSRPVSAPARRDLRLPNRKMRELQSYNAKKVNNVVQDMMTALFMAGQPDDPIEFMLGWLQENRSKHTTASAGPERSSAPMLTRLQTAAAKLDAAQLVSVARTAEEFAAGGVPPPAAPVGPTRLASARPASAGATRPSRSAPASSSSATATAAAAPPAAPQRIFVAGAPASGKGIQCEMVCSRYGLQHVSTGALIRDACKAGTPAGLEAQQALRESLPVSDATLTTIVVDALQSEAYAQQGWLLDGFPRTQEQAIALRDAGILPDVFIVLDITVEARLAPPCRLPPTTTHISPSNPMVCACPGTTAQVCAAPLRPADDADVPPFLKPTAER